MSEATKIKPFHLENDASLVKLIHERAPAWQLALSVLLKRHHQALTNFCQNRLNNRQDAEDAVQETILRAYRSLHGFKGDAAFRTWLYAIAENQCRTLAVRRQRHVLSDHLRDMLALQKSLPQGEATRAVANQVSSTLKGMPEKSRDVLMLRFFRDLSIEQIAHTLGIGLSAAKMRLYRAQHQFAAEYQRAAVS